MKRSTVLIILLHLLYWAGPVYSLLSFGNKNPNFIFSVALGLLSFYTVYFFIFPYYIQKRKVVTDTITWTLFVIILLFGVGVPIFVEYINADGRYHLNTGQIMLSGLGYSIAACLIKGFVTWAVEVEYKENLEKNNLESNLALLKARTNPHFLFNTLNNIDVLIEKDPTVASTYLKKLSDILRFTLYESPSATIPLSKEADYITQYIELQQIRTNNADFAKFSFEPGTGDLQVAPMLFIPFIENAFKYCTNKKIKKAIIISISTSQNQVIFSCSNAYDADAMVTYEESSGLGLDLIKSRLELLYPKNYQLNIDKSTDRFTVDLTITLHDDKLPDN